MTVSMDPASLSSAAIHSTTLDKINPAPGPTQIVDSNQVQDFQALVNGNQAAAPSNVTVGDSLLQGFGKMVSKIDTGLQGLESRLGDPSLPDINNIELSSVDLIKFQKDFFEVCFNLQMSGTIVNKSTQNVETFLKAQ